MSVVSFRSYCNELEEVTPFNNKEESESWLQKEELTNDGITLLVPFKDTHGKIKFLKPDECADSNKKLRIIGMANHERERNAWQKLKDCFENHRVPHIGDIEGDVIVPDEPHGFLIVYNKGEHKVGKFFYKIFAILQAKLIAEIKKSLTNDPNLQINIGQLMESLSSLAFGLLDDEEASEFDIESGRMYFIVDNRLYRYTFRKDPANKVEECYLAAEEKAKVAKEAEAYTEKSVNHHRWAAFRDYGKTVALGVVLGVIAGAITFVFLSLASVPLLAPIGAAVAGVGIAMWAIKKGVSQVAKENKDTVEYGKTTFRDFSASLFSGIKKDLQPIFGNVEKLKEEPVYSFIEASRPSEFLAVAHAQELSKPLTPIAAFSPSKSHSENQKAWFSCFPFFSSNFKFAAKADVKADQAENFNSLRMSSSG